jgi:ribonuclease D
VKKNAREWHDVVQKAKEGPGDIYERPKHPKLSMQQKARITALTTLRNKLAERWGIKGHLILNNDQIRDVIVDKNMYSLRKWQQELVEKHQLLRKSLN